MGGVYYAIKPVGFWTDQRMLVFVAPTCVMVFDILDMTTDNVVAHHLSLGKFYRISFSSKYMCIYIFIKLYTVYIYM